MTSRRSVEAGYSLAEVTVVLAITVIVLLMVMQMMEHAVQASLFVESHNDLSVMAQRPLNVIQTNLVQSKAVFQGNTAGTSYQTLMETGLIPVPSTNLLPVVDPANAFAPDTAGGTRYTGSCLLLARQLPPLIITIGGGVGGVRITSRGTGYTSAPTVTISGGGGSGATGTALLNGTVVAGVSINRPGSAYTSTPTVTFAGGGGSGAAGTVTMSTFNADRYLFEYYYQFDNIARRFSTADHYVDLIRARSEIVADYNQLNLDTAGLTATQKQAISTALSTAVLATCQSSTRDPNDPTGFSGVNDCRVTKAWNVPATSATTSAFYTFDANLALTVVAGTPVLAKRRVNTLLPELRGGRISGRMDYSIAKIPVSPAPSYALKTTLPQFFDPATAPADCGFEVKITGRPGSQTVLARLVMMSFYGINKFDSQDGFLITSIPGAVP